MNPRRPPRQVHRHFWGLALCLLTPLLTRAQEAVTPAAVPAAAAAPAGKVSELAPGIQYRFERRAEPRPLAIHVLILDLSSRLVAS